MDNKSLSNWLIASDVDGTLNNKRRQPVERNNAAIHKFINEYGGNFTLASGRCPNSIRKHYKRLNIGDGKAIVINGAGIYDFEKEEMIWERTFDEKYINLMKETVKKFPLITFQVITDKNVYIFNLKPSSRLYAINARMPVKYYWNFDHIPKEKWYKVIFTGDPITMKAMDKYVKSQVDDSSNLMFSSPLSYEIVAPGANKGTAVLALAEILGVPKENTAAIGDYYNDWEMLKAVGLPACCGQAPKKMKEISKLVTCHCNKGAVADLVEYIISNYSK